MITSNSTPRLPRRDNDVTRVKHLARGQVVTNRSAVTALAALALLNVFTLGAGVAVAAGGQRKGRGARHGAVPGRLARAAAQPEATDCPARAADRRATAGAACRRGRHRPGHR